MAGLTRSLDAFSIALNQADSSGWYSSTMQLQLASLQFCVMCRSVSTLHLVVIDDRQTLPFEDAPTSTVNVEKLRRTRVPNVCPLILTWKLPAFYLKRFSSKALAYVKQLTFRDAFEDKVDDVAWPPSLQRLTPSLQRLTFGHRFNQTVDGFVWPASLQQLTFGYHFNQAIDGVVWPATLQQLKGFISTKR